MAKRTSAPCAKEGCGRSVRYDNPSFPFCYQHGKTMRARSTFEKLASMDMKGIREVLYNPARTILNPMRVTSEILSTTSHIPFKEALSVHSAWSRANKDVKYWIPEESLRNRDRVNAELSDVFHNNGYHVEHAYCSNGIILVPDRGSLSCGDHEVLLVQKENMALIVDGSTAAPLYGVVDNVREEFPSGDSNVADGLYIAMPFEYGGFSSVSYSTIYTDNEKIWESKKINEDSSVHIQRELAKNNPPAPIDIDYRVDKEEEEEEEKEEEKENVSEAEPQEMSLEELLAKEEGSR